MIFLQSVDNTDVFMMLTEQDVNDMRGGRTKFIDDRHIRPGIAKIVLSLHKNREEIHNILRRAGHGNLLDKSMVGTEPKPEEGKCRGCQAVTLESSLLDGKCIACWREAALINRKGQS